MPEALNGLVLRSKWRDDGGVKCIYLRTYICLNCIHTIIYCIFIYIYIYETTLKQQFYKTIFESWSLSDQQLYPSKLDFVTQPWSMDAGKRRRWMSRFMAKQMPRPETQPTNEQEST